MVHKDQPRLGRRQPYFQLTIPKLLAEVLKFQEDNLSESSYEINKALPDLPWQSKLPNVGEILMLFIAQHDKKESQNQGHYHHDSVTRQKRDNAGPLNSETKYDYKVSIQTYSSILIVEYITAYKTAVLTLLDIPHRQINQLTLQYGCCRCDISMG